MIERGDRILALYQLQAKGFFMQAGLPPMVLAQVLYRLDHFRFTWLLSDLGPSRYEWRWEDGH